MNKLWAGDDVASYHLVVHAQSKVEALQAQAPTMAAGWMDDMIASLPPIWRHEGDTAVIDINGPLVAGDAGFMRLFGVLGYDNLLSAARAAAAHPDTKALMFAIETPGGEVSGLIEACEELTKITSLKPSATHTSDQMCSAGYWLASAITGNYITAGHTAAVGSIGVLKIHTEQSKAMEERGIKTTVLRSGKYKAELNPIEQLTPEVQARAESQLNDVHNMFRAQVAKGRPNLSAEDLAEVTEGQVYLGQRAVRAGLADKVGSFNLALNLLDKRKQSRDTSSKSKGKAMNLTPEQLKAHLAGTPLQAFGYNDDGTDMSAAEIEAYTAKVAADAEAARIAAEAAAAKQPTAGELAQVDLLKEQLATANAEIVKLQVAASAHTAIAAAHEGLLAIARGATAQMLIPMGGTSAAVDGMDAASVIAEHARVKPLFLAKFPGGRQSLASNEDHDDKGTSAAVLPLGFEFALKNAPTAKR